MKDVPQDPRPAPLDAADKLREHRVASERVYAGALLDVRRDRVRLPDGAETVREYIVHPGAVLVIPVRDDGRFVVERQYRYPHDRAFVEFPAGKLDAGETPLATGVRELAEEVGYEAAIWTRLGVIHPVISYSTETIEIYAARGLAHVGAKLDAGEFLEVADRSEAELYAALDEGRLTDAKTIAALALYTRWTGTRLRCARIRVTGLVQGVGYRDWAIRAAQAAGIAGWVRNRADGAVEMRIQGDRGTCDRFVDACVRGPRAARVERIELARSACDAALAEFTLRASD
jgi:ADP-ribose pyrophosphatase